MVFTREKAGRREDERQKKWSEERVRQIPTDTEIKTSGNWHESDS